MASEEISTKTPQGAGTETRYQDPSSQGQGCEDQAPPRRRAPARAIDRLTDQLVARGFGFADDFVGPGLLEDLRARCQSLHEAGALRAARIGRGPGERLAPDIRGDFIAWLSEPELDAEQLLLARMEELRVAMNRGLMAGLEDFQGHFARYPAGATYARHNDRLSGTDVRAISVALYLNNGWTDADGGVLRIYTGGESFQDVLPVGGRLVAFLSDRFEHEVLPARRERLSFTGWYRRRPLEGFV